MAQVGRKKREETVRESYKFNKELDLEMKEHCQKTNQVMCRFVETAIREKLDREMNK